MRNWGKEITFQMWAFLVDIFKSVDLSQFTLPEQCQSNTAGDQTKTKLAAVGCLRGIFRLICLLQDAYEKADFSSILNGRPCSS